MTDTSRSELRRVLALGYDDLRTRLTRRLNSIELAGDALQDTYLELCRGQELAPVQKPKAYLLRMAVNIASRKLRGEKNVVSLDDAKTAFDIVDDAPDQQRRLEASMELNAFRQAVAELTPRRRTILYAARIEGLTLRMIAERLGVSQRLVEIELKHALAHCALRLDRNIVQRFGPRSLQHSSEQEQRAAIDRAGSDVNPKE